MSRTSLYVHVPFCRRSCHYCSFYHVPATPELERAFVATAVDEATRALDSIPGGAAVSTVYVGGGSPSILAADSWSTIFEAIEPYYARDESVEITCELNPEDVTARLVDFLSGLGVNRLSVGVQSMDRVVQRVLGRCAPETNRAAMDLIREQFENVSVDVLAGVPSRSRRAVEHTLAELMTWCPAHFSVYCLEPGEAAENGAQPLFEAVDPDRSADDYLLACATLEKAGYVHYEVSNFALPGRECRHNTVYWERGDYIGVGPGAHSYLKGRRFHNTPDLQAYLERGRRPGGGEPVPDPIDTEGENAERLMLGLRTAKGVALESLRCPEGVIRDILREGYGEVDGGRLRLTDRGYLLLNEIVLRLMPLKRPPQGGIGSRQ